MTLFSNRLTKTALRLALIPTMLIALGAQADSPEVLTFSGSCSVYPIGKAPIEIGQFKIEARKGECPSQTLDFELENYGTITKHGVYLEFQRSAFSETLNDKPAIGHYNKAEGSLKDMVMIFNVVPGGAVHYKSSLPGDNMLGCEGTIQ